MPELIGGRDQHVQIQRTIEVEIFLVYMIYHTYESGTIAEYEMVRVLAKLYWDEHLAF